MSNILQYRRDTAANWTSANPTLASGEIGFETDTLNYKVGNGSLAWNLLSYVGKPMPAGAVVGTTDTQTLTNKVGNIPITTVLNNPISNGVYSYWTVPTVLRVVGTVFKVTVVGGGGSAYGTNSAGVIGGGGGSAGVAIAYYTYVAGVNYALYVIGRGGIQASSTTANDGTASYFAYGGNYTYGNFGSGGTSTTGGAGGSATSAAPKSLLFNGYNGYSGGTNAATTTFIGHGANTPLGFGVGGQYSAPFIGTATGYGSGGAGGSAVQGGAGGNGIIIIEY